MATTNVPSEVRWSGSVAPSPLSSSWLIVAGDRLNLPAFAFATSAEGASPVPLVIGTDPA
jgi:hypothetical protein